jgi:hypothetical protein
MAYKVVKVHANAPRGLGVAPPPVAEAVDVRAIAKLLDGDADVTIIINDKWNTPDPEARRVIHSLRSLILEALGGILRDAHNRSEAARVAAVQASQREMMQRSPRWNEFTRARQAAIAEDRQLVAESHGAAVVQRTHAPGGVEMLETF